MGPELVLQQDFSGEQTHSRETLVAIDQACRRAGWRPGEIDQVYVSVGPGSFTGLRVGITAAKALAFAEPVKVVAVPSLDVMVLNTESLGVFEGVAIAAVMDAKRQQVYAAVYTQNGQGDPFLPGFRRKIEPTVIFPADLLTQISSSLYVLGDGLRWRGRDFCAERVTCLPESYWRPQAANVLRCGWLRAQAGVFTDPDLLTPLYLRRPEAVEKWEQLHGVNHHV